MKSEVTFNEALNLIDDKYVTFKTFIKNKKPIYCEIKNGEVVFDEVGYFERQYMIIYDKQRNELSFRDDLTDINKMWELYSIDINITKPIHDKLLDDIKQLGCKLRIAEGGNEDYQWYDLVINPSKFSEELLKQCTILWSKFNDDMDVLK